MTFSLVQQFVDDPQSYRQRDPNNITHCVIHRSGPWPDDYGDPQDAQDLISIFTKENLGTGFQMPYTFVYNPRTRIMYQSNYVTALTPHAKSQNRTGVGLAILQDLRQTALTPDAYATLVKFCAYLNQQFRQDLTFAAHTDLPDATSDLSKECPGSMLDCDRLNEDVHLAHKLIYAI